MVEVTEYGSTVVEGTEMLLYFYMSNKNGFETLSLMKSRNQLPFPPFFKRQCFKDFLSYMSNNSNIFLFFQIILSHVKLQKIFLPKQLKYLPLSISLLLLHCRISNFFNGYFLIYVFEEKKFSPSCNIKIVMF